MTNTRLYGYGNPSNYHGTFIQLDGMQKEDSVKAGLLGKTVSEYRITYDASVGCGDSHCPIICCLGGGGGNGKAEVVLLLIVGAVLLALSSFVSWTVTGANASQLSNLRARFKAAEENVARMPESIRNHLYDYDTALDHSSPQYKMCSLQYHTFELAKKQYREMAIKSTFQASISLGLTLLTTATIIAVFVELNLFSAPLLLYGLTVSGTGTLVIGIAGYGFNALAHSNNLTHRFEIDRIVQENFNFSNNNN